MPRSAVYFDFGVSRGSGTKRSAPVDTGPRRIPPGRSRRSLLGAAPPRRGAPAVSRRTAGDGPRARVPYGGRARGVFLRVGLRTQRDDVGQLGHGVQVAELGQALEPEGVQGVAGQQGEVRIAGPHDPPLAVVLQIA